MISDEEPISEVTSMYFHPEKQENLKDTYGQIKLNCRITGIRNTIWLT
jgi:hypothetical protein